MSFPPKKQPTGGPYMAYVKANVDGELGALLRSGKWLSATEQVELDVNWQFFNQFVQLTKNVLATLPQMPGWAAIQAGFPQTRHVGACDWRDVCDYSLNRPVFGPEQYCEPI